MVKVGDIVISKGEGGIKYRVDKITKKEYKLCHVDKGYTLFISVDFFNKYIKGGDNGK